MSVHQRILGQVESNNSLGTRYSVLPLEANTHTGNTGGCPLYLAGEQGTPLISWPCSCLSFYLFAINLCISELIRLILTFFGLTVFVRFLVLGEGQVPGSLPVLPVLLTSLPGSSVPFPLPLPFHFPGSTNEHS